MSVRETLLAARERISEPSKWLRHSMARNHLGYPVEPHDPTATCFCLAGAIRLSPVMTDDWAEARRLLIQTIGPLARFNDDPNTTHEMVLNAIDTALCSTKS